MTHIDKIFITTLFALLLFKGELDYEEFVPINTTATISTAFNLKIIDDDIAMEMNESIILSFMPLGSNSILEPEGEYIRNLATVNIIDNDSKSVFS